jgi:hypothetical protein
MNPIQKALDEVKREIPAYILNIAFKPQQSSTWGRAPVSLDERIMHEVIRPRVLIDCNLMGGTEAYISLAGLQTDRTDDYTTVYRVPKSRTQNRSIISVMNITFTSPDSLNAANAGNNMGGSALMNLAQGMMDAHGNIPNISTAKVQLIGENVIAVRDPTIMPGYCYLRCILANDENLNHLQLKSYGRFCELVIYAVKAHIYNELILSMDLGQLHGGQALGEVKNIVSEYKECNELYKTFLREKWAKIGLMNDVESHTRLLKKFVGGHR